LTGHDVVADVSYDALIFTSKSTTASHSYEVMIWLAQIGGGAAPLGNSNMSIETVTIEDTSWDLYKGTNKGWTVYSFVASSDQNDFEGDVNEFFYIFD
jgi:xyloglucan-specific endo-beta-1,4-glucanase